MKQLEWKKTIGMDSLLVTSLIKQKNFLFAGTSTHGVYWSFDGGENWF